MVRALQLVLSEPLEPAMRSHPDLGLLAVWNGPSRLFSFCLMAGSGQQPLCLEPIVEEFPGATCLGVVTSPSHLCVTLCPCPTVNGIHQPTGGTASTVASPRPVISIPVQTLTVGNVSVPPSGALGSLQTGGSVKRLSRGFGHRPFSPPSQTFPPPAPSLPSCLVVAPKRRSGAIMLKTPLSGSAWRGCGSVLQFPALRSARAARSCAFTALQRWRMLIAGAAQQQL